MDYCDVIKYETVHNEQLVKIIDLELLLSKVKEFDKDSIIRLIKDYPSIANLTNINRAYMMGKELFSENKLSASDYFWLGNYLMSNLF